KTLTLQCLAGLLRPDEGRIVVDGRLLFEAGRQARGPVVDLPPQARRVGYVFQGYALFPHLTVAENVGFGLRDQPAARRAEKTAEVLGRPASEAVARIMGIRNVLHGSVVKATPDRIQIRWRGQLLEAVNSPSHSYLPAPDSPIAFFIRPEYVRLIRKDRGAADPAH